MKQHTIHSEKTVIGLVLLALLVFVFPERCRGYIMPAEQIIQFMASNFSKFETLIITQSIRQEDQKDKESVKVFKEKIWMKTPSLFHSKVLDQTGERVVIPDFFYRRLLIANNEKRLEQILSGIGINLESVALTRIDGIIAYRIGDRLPDAPKLLIEKERFLPLFLQYRLPENPGMETIAVRFRDHRKLEQGWYPFEIIYSEGSKIRESYTIDTLQANVPVSQSLFDTSEIKSRPAQAPEKGTIPKEEEERLRKIIKEFDKKYRR